MNSNDGNMASVVSTERIYILSVAQASNVDLLQVPHMAAQIFCLHVGGYEMKVHASTLEMAFADIVVILCHGHFHFR